MADAITTANLYADTVSASAITTSNLYADTVSANAITTANAYADSVVANKVTAQDVSSIVASFGYVTAKQVDSQIGNYGYITSKAVYADFMEVNNWVTKVGQASYIKTGKLSADSITTALSDPSQGSINVGNINAQQFTLYVGDGNYKALKYVRGTVGGKTAFFAYHE